MVLMFQMTVYERNISFTNFCFPIFITDGNRVLKTFDKTLKGHETIGIFVMDY